MAKPTLAIVKANLQSIANGALLNPINAKHAEMAERLRDVAPNLCTIRSAQIEADVMSSIFSDLGDHDTATLIESAVEGLR